MIIALLLLAVPSAVATDCETVRAPSAGWFGVVLRPRQTIQDALYAVRADDTVVIEEAANQGARVDSYSDHHTRRESLTLTLSYPGAERARFVFARPLDNMEVDAVGYTTSGARIRLLDEKRVRDRVLEIESPMAGLRSIELVLHHGLRKTPILESFVVAYVGKLGSIERLDPSFSEPGYSFFYVAEAQTVRLCIGDGAPPVLPAGVIVGKRAKLLAR